MVDLLGSILITLDSEQLLLNGMITMTSCHYHTDSTPSSVTATPAVRRSNRIHHPPDHYTPDNDN